MTLKDFFKKDRFAALAGVELLEVKQGYAKACMLVTPEHLNGGGVCQGGALFTLADLACAAAFNSHLILTLGTSANITFMANVSEGYVFASQNALCRNPRDRRDRQAAGRLYLKRIQEKRGGHTR